MFSAGQTFHSSHFRLASVKMSENITSFCFCISTQSFIHWFINLCAVMAGGLCSISKIMKEIIKPFHSDFLEFRNYKRTG